MASKAMTYVLDSLNPSAYSADQRPPLTITTKGRLAIVPDLDEFMSRRGTKGLQLCLEELTHHYFMVHGYEWRYAGGTITSYQSLYFVSFGGTVSVPDVHYLGKYRQAVDFLMHYAKTGTPNDSMRRAR